MANSMDEKRRRPSMKNYGIAKGKSGLMSWDWVDEQMAKSRNYWIISTRPDGRPHAAPVWGVWHEGALYFGSDPESRKARNIAHQPEIVVHLESGDDTVILEGKVVEERDPERIAPVDKLYAAKYPPFDPTPSAGYLVLRPHTALAWTEKDFPNTATRWDLG
jgi:hypothetical protein